MCAKSCARRHGADTRTAATYAWSRPHSRTPVHAAVDKHTKQCASFPIRTAWPSGPSIARTSRLQHSSRLNAYVCSFAPGLKQRVRQAQPRPAHIKAKLVDKRSPLGDLPRRSTPQSPSSRSFLRAAQTSRVWFGCALMGSWFGWHCSVWEGWLTTMMTGRLGIHSGLQLLAGTGLAVARGIVTRLAWHGGVLD